MRPRNMISMVVVALCVTTAPASATDLRVAIEADNARWNEAFNMPDPQAFPAMYTSDALLLPPGRTPVDGGPEAIRQFWEGAIARGAKEHAFEIVSTHEDGRYAYQVARWSVVLVKEDGERTPLTGNTVRIYERQDDGRWLTKVHMYNRHQ
jgi:uncharacterized protein (TIGR02246 family)